ncbi:helix-turn-helix domain-containing protein [Planktomarina temperata]|nr:helix-turn-helix domain-containing protein [Planktomarina temperata]
MKQVERGHWSNEAKEYYYAKRAAALGVRTKAENQHVTNVTSSPSQEEHADTLGVSRPTIARWEKDIKDVMSDPELAEKASTPEGHKEAKKVVRDTHETVERKGLLYALAPLK